MDYPDRSNVITRVLRRGRQESWRERFEDAALLVWKAEEGVTSQECRWNPKKQTVP